MAFESKIQTVIDYIADLPEEKRIEVINQLKIKLHEISPFKNEPVDCVLWVKFDSVKANDYNPNKVAPPEMYRYTHCTNECDYDTCKRRNYGQCSCPDYRN